MHAGAGRTLIGTLLLVLVGATGIWSSLISEHRSTQPIVVVHAAFLLVHQTSPGSSM